MIIKHIDTLFHGTVKISHLVSIIQNGFYPSYANEPFASRNTKILMVSFSNIPLIEARNQVNYGDYFIGLKRDWGISNQLHPVAYSYQDSKYEKDVNYLQLESAIGQTLHLLRSFHDNGIKMDFGGEALQLVAELSRQDISEETSVTLNKMFEKIYVKINDMQLYLKHYKVTDKKGLSRYAYNDREWRYIPYDIEQRRLLFETDASGKNINPEYTKYDQMKKPHFKSHPLLFGIDDITYIIVKKKEEIKRIYKVLEKKYGSTRVYENITNGNLTVLSIDKIWSDL